MIFIFGTRSSVRPAVQTDYTCPACGREHAIFAVPQQRYFHVFWIPIFPIYRSYSMVCGDCGGLFDTAHMPVPKEVKQQVKTPKWTFIGLILIALFVVFVAITGSSASSDRKSGAMAKIENPTVGDIYQVKEAYKEYTLYKVASATKDSIYFYPHGYTINKKSAFDELKADEFLDEDDEYVEGFSKAELKADVESGKILKITR